MPCIKVIDAIKLYIYARDHNPPHFHAIYAEYEELIIIDSLETYIGAIPKRQRRKVINWASQHQAFMMARWNELNPNLNR